MLLRFEEHTWGLDIHTLCNFSSLRILHVTIKILTVSGCCPWHMDDLGEIFSCGNLLQSNRNNTKKK